MTFGKRFKLVRKNHKLSQTEAAELIGVKNYQLANYEADRSEPSLSILIRMAEVYNTSIDKLLGVTKLQKRAEKELDVDLMEEQTKETLKIVEKFVKEYQSLTTKKDS